MIAAVELTKRYGVQTVIEDVTFSCEAGTVTGFLGPNGAGKSTTLRMLCGLGRPDRGHATVLGRPYAQLPNPATQVGVLLDASAQHAGRRGSEVLAIAAGSVGVGQERVGELLTLVGLDGSAARKRVGAYSLGMRQRLGIAHALIGDPEVLILDEPANGLDPEGMRWMRELLRDFADRGGTVLLSSHLLREVEAIADRLVIISHGRIVAQGTRDELLACGGSQTLVRAADDDALRDALAGARIVARPAPEGGLLADAQPDVIGRVAMERGLCLRHLAPSDGVGLEELFMELTTDEGRSEEREEVAA
jgi:ABC-2 type transport system ATP-binding protein